MTVDLSGSLYKLYKDTRKEADAARERGAVREAGSLYLRSARWMRKYAEYTHDSSIRKQRLDRAEKLEALAVELGKSPSAARTPTLERTLASQQRQNDDNRTAGEDDYEEEVIKLIVQDGSIRWEDIGGLDDTKETIKLAYALALAKKPTGVHVASWRNLLLYGPPGTGKTLLAAATAGSLEAVFFNVKVSSLLSKYFGESTKLISALFSVARRLSPAVIFLDEFEALTPPRGGGESGAERRIVSTLLAELDGLSGKGDESFVMTMCATNMPWLLDMAILARFQRRIYVPLPDEKARRAILEIHTTKQGYKTEPKIETLVRRTDGYSGREIEQVCRVAVNAMFRRLNPGLIKLADDGAEKIKAYTLKIEPISETDFHLGFNQVQPLATQILLQRYEQWHQQIDS